jgi:WD40 repeat protein
VVIQVGGDLYLSDAGLTSLWSPKVAAPGECPYPGLDAFGPGQARWFYGREHITSDLLRHLDEMTLGGAIGPLLVVAPSGAGKSSLLGAGLLNAVAQGRLPAAGSANWPRVLITPGPHPLDTLRAAMATLASAQTVSAGHPRPAHPDHPAHPGGAAARTPREARVVLVIDQLEEIFTVCESEAERSGFLDEIATLAADAGSGSALVVLGMRADFYARATLYPVLRRSMQGRQVVLGAMSSTEVRQAIVRPARAEGFTLEAGLTERLLRDLGVLEAADTRGGRAGAGGGVGGANGADRTDGPDAVGGAYEAGRLPLLAHALRATWERREGNRLTVAGYEATGGIAGAIARTAEDVYGQLSPPEQAAARQLFLGLVRVGSATGDGDEAADARRRVAAEGLIGGTADPAAASRALEAYTTARLLTSGGQAVEITHEALLRRWPRLRGWIDEDRSGLLVRQELEDDAAKWTREGRDSGGLYQGVRLAAAQAWASVPAHAAALTQAAREFLIAAEHRRRRGTRRRNAIIAVLAALSLVLAGLSVFALNERSTAQGQRAQAEANFKVAEAGLLSFASGQASSDFRQDTAQKLAVAGYQLDPSSAQARSALLTIQAVPIAGRLLVDGAPVQGDYTDVAYNPAGTLIAGTTDDDYVALWDAANYKLLWRFQFPKIGGAQAAANAVAFTPDGKTLIVSQHGGPWLFDVANPAHPVHVATLPTPAVPHLSGPPQLTSLAISPNGHLVAGGVVTNSADLTSGEVAVWNVASRSIAGVIPGTGAVDHLAFTPDGRSVVGTTFTGGVLEWNVATGAVVATVQAPSPGLASITSDAVAVSPNGALIAFAGHVDNKNSSVTATVNLWNVATRQVVTTLNGGTDGMNSLAFSPDGNQIAAADIGGNVRLWDLTTPATPGLLGIFAGHRASVQNIAFSPDGTRLASASYDGTIGLWDTQGTTLGGVANGSIATAFSPDGRTLAISTFGHRKDFVALYAMPARRLIGTLPTSGLAALAFSPDGKTLAVASLNTGGAVQLWNVGSQTMMGTLATGLTSRTNSMAFSPDGTLLAISGIQDTTFQVWSATTLKRVAVVSDRQNTLNAASIGGVLSLAFSPDGRLLATADQDGFVRIYSVPGYSLAAYFYFASATQITAVAISPNGRELATGTDSGSVTLWTLPASVETAHGTGQIQINALTTFDANTKYISGVQFLSNSTLISGGYDGDVRFWTVPADAQTKSPPTVTQPTQTLGTHEGNIGSFSYSASTGLLATAAPSGTRVWQTEPSVVATDICRTEQSPVRPDLWKDYLPGLPYMPVC